MEGWRLAGLGLGRVRGPVVCWEGKDRRLVVCWEAWEVLEGWEGWGRVGKLQDPRLPLLPHEEAGES